MNVQRVAAAGGISLAYEVTGSSSAPPMVLLHGLGGRAAKWWPVIPAFAKHFRVFALDMRGHGDSDWPGTCSFQLMCDDVVAVLDELDLSKVTAARISHCDLVTIPAGHDVHTTRPAEFTAAVLTWLRG